MFCSTTLGTKTSKCAQERNKNFRKQKTVFETVNKHSQNRGILVQIYYVLHNHQILLNLCILTLNIDRYEMMVVFSYPNETVMEEHP